ncbi:MAG: apolipoprotein N-acyltransferase [Elusimicrobia bacterium]|nr:apolipoprotein N-acyltransferase [Elusimicrobiota bacterium]
MASGMLAALLCGAATGLALPRPGLCLLAWFSLAPLFWLWRGSRDWRAAALIGWAAGFGYHGLVLYWVYSTCRFAGLPVLVGLAAWAVLAAFLALNWGLIGALGRRFAEGRPAVWRPWAWAALWTAVTFFCERWTPRLCTDLLEYTQGRHLALLQVSSLAGPHFLGFLIVAANAALEQAWAESGGRPRHAATAPNLAAVLALLAWSWGYGVFALTQRGSVEPGPAARVELLQPAVDQYEKFDAAHATAILANFDELLAAPRAAAPILVVWPETCLPYVVAGKGLLEPAAWGRRLGAWQIVGAVSQQGADMRNSAFLLDPAGQAAGVYHKRQLVPFGEFQPFPFLGRFVGILDQLGGLTAGAAEQPFFDTPLGRIAGSICYEAMFPRLARADAARGARLLVNVTNDGWYKDTWAPDQHFAANMCRAIEDRVTVLRSGNTGISGVIDPWGVVTARLDLNARGRLEAAVPLGDPFPSRSFYARQGDWFGALCLLAGAGLIAIGLRPGPGRIS